MKRSDCFPSNYLAACDLPEEGMNVTIRYIEEAKMRDGKDKPVMFFEEVEKGMVLNVTNWRTIETLCGEESDDWEHQRITLYPSVTTFDGEETACIRVRKKAPKPSVAPAANGKRSKVAETADALKGVKPAPFQPTDEDEFDESPPF